MVFVVGLENIFLYMLDYGRNRRINGLEACLSIKSIKGQQGDVHLSASLLFTCLTPWAMHNNQFPVLVL